MNNFEILFGRLRSVIIGMVHVRALPGSPRHSTNLADIIDTACREAKIYKKANVDAILVENMHDVPWQLPRQMAPHTTSFMSVVCAAVRKQVPDLPIGVQVLSAANKEALAVAAAADLNFIRAEGFVYSHIGDEGPIHSCAAELLRYRQEIGASDIQIFTDIKKKHSSHQITSDVSIGDTAKAAELFQSDGLIVTGSATGEPTSINDLNEVNKSVKLPVLVGSGVNEDNIAEYMNANGIIIGSHLKMHGEWDKDLDHIRVNYFMRKVKKLRQLAADGTAKQEDEEEFTTILAQGE